MTKGNATRTIHIYSSAPTVELYLNEESQGTRQVSRMISNKGTYGEFKVPWKVGTLKAVARSNDGTAVAETTVVTNMEPAKLLLSLDCPSVATGTGESLFLDGQDVALVRASIVDSTGQISHMATHNVTFVIRSGPGKVIGTANGDSKSYQPHTSPSQAAYHGLVRAVVQVTSIAAIDMLIHERMRSIDRYSVLFAKYPATSETGDIIIEASTPGLPKATLLIPTSTDPKAAVLSVAAAGAGLPVDFFQPAAGIEEREIIALDS